MKENRSLLHSCHLAALLWGKVGPAGNGLKGMLVEGQAVARRGRAAVLLGGGGGVPRDGLRDPCAADRPGA